MTAALLSKPDAKRSARRQCAMKHIDVPLTIDEWLSMNGAGAYSRKRFLPKLIPNIGGECLSDPQAMFEVDMGAAFSITRRIQEDLIRFRREYDREENDIFFSAKVRAAYTLALAAEDYIETWFRRVLAFRAGTVKRSAAE